jgi:hypothetical protein
MEWNRVFQDVALIARNGIFGSSRIEKVASSTFGRFSASGPIVI